MTVTKETEKAITMIVPTMVVVIKELGPSGPNNVSRWEVSTGQPQVAIIKGGQNQQQLEIIKVGAA